MLRLKLDKIEQKPKEISKVEPFKISFAKTFAELSPEIKKGLNHITECIFNGTSLDDGYYRSFHKGKPDKMLYKYGIMHLHVTGNSHSNELLFLVQYSDYVVLLELSDHSYFKYDPPGEFLENRYTKKLEEIANERKKRKEEKEKSNRDLNADYSARIFKPKS